MCWKIDLMASVVSVLGSCCSSFSHADSVYFSRIDLMCLPSLCRCTIHSSSSVVIVSFVFVCKEYRSVSMCGGSGRWSLFARFRVFWAIVFCVCVVELLFSMSSSCSSVFISSPMLLIARFRLYVVVGLLCMLRLCGFDTCAPGLIL